MHQIKSRVAQMRSSERLLYLAVAQLRDVQTLHSDAISPESLKLTAAKVVSRVSMEGIGFLTKSLPRLGKALDRALSGEVTLNAESEGFKPMDGSVLPVLLGELFQRVFTNDGCVRVDACVSSIKSLRQFLYSFYKYKLPYDTETEVAVLDKFVETEKEVTRWSEFFSIWNDALISTNDARVNREVDKVYPFYTSLAMRARRLLFRALKDLDLRDIKPSHGPGAVATGEQLHEKWTFSQISPRLAEVYPIDEFFFSSLSHVCDRPEQLERIEVCEVPAKVVLVPKDSRGPRLISEESLSNQWIQQGQMRAIVRHVERHPLTKDNVHFTNQQPNRFGALLGSSSGKFATLDLAEASDRVSVGLVKLLFPGNVCDALMASRSLSTVLPDGRVIKLNKFAPMGSATCFPVLALTVWALLSVGAPDAESREGLLVYGDDVVVRSGYAAHAIRILEAFGLKVNKHKSFSSGFFRESCGLDAYKGVEVTPVRFSTVWTSRPCPETLTAWCEYANGFYKRSFFYTYECIAGWLLGIYRVIPEVSQGLPCPSLMEVPELYRPRRRVNYKVQILQYMCWDVRSRNLELPIDGWSMLLRHLTNSVPSSDPDYEVRIKDFLQGLSAIGSYTSGRRALIVGKGDLQFDSPPFSVCLYTRPGTTRLAKRWIPHIGGDRPRLKCDPQVACKLTLS